MARQILYPSNKHFQRGGNEPKGARAYVEMLLSIIKSLPEDEQPHALIENTGDLRIVRVYTPTREEIREAALETLQASLRAASSTGLTPEQVTALLKALP